MIINVDYANVKLYTNKNKKKKYKVCLNMITRINCFNERIKHSFKGTFCRVGKDKFVVSTV